MTWDGIGTGSLVLTYDRPLTAASGSSGPYVELKTAPYGVVSSSGNAWIVSGNTVTFEIDPTDPWEAETLRTLFLDNTGGEIMDADGVPVPSIDATAYTQTPTEAQQPVSITWDTNSLTAFVLFPNKIAVGTLENLSTFQIQASNGTAYVGASGSQADDFTVAIVCEAAGGGDSSETCDCPLPLGQLKVLGDFQAPTWLGLSIMET